MEHSNIDDIVEKYKKRLIATKEAERFRRETVEPLVDKVFEEEFVKVFENDAQIINNKVEAEVIKHYKEGKDKFIIEGFSHKIYFQKSQIELIANSVQANIIPVYTWKGITKHLGPISFVIDLDNEQTGWDIPFGTTEAYARNIFTGIVEDKIINF